MDNTAVRLSQIKQLKELKDQRDEFAVQQALDTISQACENGKGNLLDLAVKAAQKQLLWAKFRMLVKKFLVAIRHKTIRYQVFIRWK